MKQPALSVIVPAYNEEEIILSSIKANLDTLAQFAADFEMIIVNDGSTDRTDEIINNEFSNHPNIRIIKKACNEGFGSAVKTGIADSKNQYLLCVPADSPLTTDVFSSFYQSLGKADIIVSYRKERLGYTPIMKLNSWGFHKVISLLFNMRLRDYNWIHLYDRKIFEQGKIVIEYDGIFMLAELLIKAKRAGFTFYEIEVVQHQRITGIATASKLSSVIKVSRDILRFWFTGK